MNRPITDSDLLLYGTTNYLPDDMPFCHPPDNHNGYSFDDDLIADAFQEFNALGVLCADTTIKLNDAGYDPDDVANFFSNYV